MSNKFTSLTLALCLTSTAQAAIESGSVAAQTVRLAATAPIMAISTTEEHTLAVGDRGTILSRNAQHWQQAAVPVNVLLTDISWGDKNTAWVVGHDATIVTTADGGNSWQLQQYIPSLDRPLLDVYFANARQGIAVGAYGLYFSTNDGGKQWQQQFLMSLLPQDDIDYLQEVKLESEEEYQFEIASILPHFNQVIALNDQQLLMVGELGLIALSDDMGQNWRRLDDIYAGSFFSALKTKQQTILIGGLRGNVFRSTDTGHSWQQVTLDNNYSVNKFHQLADGTIYIAQNNGVLLKSTDDGRTFEQAALYKGKDLVGITQVGEQLWLASSKGLTKHLITQ
ncbi:MAG: hypothetical protein HRU23_14970 [Gammaproteobacteria bacterium]|nr:hypothetical protein [Gammaproteobacteria bacterium]